MKRGSALPGSASREGPGEGPLPVSAPRPRRLGREPLPVVAPWEVDLRPAGGSPFRRRFPQLFDLSLAAGDPEVAGFGGIAVYRAEFDWTDETRTVLGLGTVHGVSAVRLNGKRPRHPLVGPPPLRRGGRAREGPQRPRGRGHDDPRQPHALAPGQPGGEGLGLVVPADSRRPRRPRAADEAGGVESASTPMTLRTGGSLLAGLVGTALSLACARAEPPHVPPPLPAVAGEDAPGLPPSRGLAPQRELRDRRAARPGEEDDRRDPRPRVAEHERPGALQLPVPPLLERLPERPLDQRARRGPKDPGRPGARGAVVRVDPGEERPPGRRGRGHDSRPDPHAALPGRDGNVDDRTVFEVRTGKPGRARRDGPLPGRVGGARAPRQRRPRGLGPRLPLHRPVVPEDRGLLEGRAGTPTRSTPGRSSSPTSASTTSG